MSQPQQGGFDWQRFAQLASRRLSACIREKFTGRLLVRVCHRSGRPKRGTVSAEACRIFNREPFRAAQTSPAEILNQLVAQNPATGAANEDSEFSVIYEFFGGVAVDIRTTVVQHI